MGEILVVIIVIAIIIAMLGGAVKTFQRNWIAALLLLLFLFPVWAIWAFIEIFTDDVVPQQTVHYVQQPAPPAIPQAPVAPPALPAATKECPFCAETIREAAVVCRFCQRDLPPAEA